MLRCTTSIVLWLWVRPGSRGLDLRLWKNKPRSSSVAFEADIYYALLHGIPVRRASSRPWECPGYMPGAIGSVEPSSGFCRYCSTKGHLSAVKRFIRLTLVEVLGNSTRSKLNLSNNFSSGSYNISLGNAVYYEL
ncbi:uncharacterized protein CANTADRAFT_171318 [Suhomyces tanzawaensis NRRL Y-17324]|uniref:Secreted protein n=1 Tax=Suhomyces tanzawaensis NRRL Y-17324 TaxID=984487 RepID=A0A1E4SMP9_9ASCO|nr:uncharacterized protein CANTADRAFT_171318 [Suhomyces tanzawaensis NRRL Y-17324]ODV80766.1 hypothetical protein CANTADRAFT_171318 [Suhomyces tanzawaensis NRRL Y-17324]